MDVPEFRTHAHDLVDWMADYLEQVGKYPVRSQVAPNHIFKQIPDTPPLNGEPFPQIFADFENVIIPGMTHWQHPRFFAYFNANSSPPSLLAEMLTATLGAQCMIWETSPAATELEERMMQWLGQMIGLPDDFTGVIQDTASTATLCSILTAREKLSNFGVNQRGLQGSPEFAVYCSQETHSSIEKAVRIAGLGSACIRKLPVDDRFALQPSALTKAIDVDIQNKVTPLCVVATIGTTSSTAIDPLRAIGEICRTYDIWLHVDAAHAGTALLLPEMRSMIDGIELADTFVFNPHKWMLTNFDCSAYFVKDVSALVRTFEILPEYLKTQDQKPVKNYRDWGVQLGRRFRSLKLWFVIRTYGVTGLQQRIKTHIELAQQLAGTIENASDFELMAPCPVNLVTFRYHPQNVETPHGLDRLNQTLLSQLNDSGNVYLSHTRLRGAYTLRMAIGQTAVTQQDVDEGWEMIQRTARSLK
jgi:aromatic-L-amino-acid decarboxylase